MATLSCKLLTVSTTLTLLLGAQLAKASPLPLEKLAANPLVLAKDGLSPRSDALSSLSLASSSGLGLLSDLKDVALEGQPNLKLLTVQLGSEALVLEKNRLSLTRVLGQEPGLLMLQKTAL